MLLQHEEKLNQVHVNIVSFGENILQATNEILNALNSEKIDSLKKVKIILKNIDTNSSKIDNNIVTILALFGAEATELRKLVAYLKITNELTRISDNMKTFAKNMTVYMQDKDSFYIYKEYLTQLAKASISAVSLSIELLSSQSNIDYIYRKIKIEESKSDDLYSILEKSILEDIYKNSNFSTDFMRILSTIRKLEKMADRSVSVGKLMLFAVNGGKL